MLVIGTGEGRKGSKDKWDSKCVWSNDHSNDKMHIHCYQKKTTKQFIDFLKRVEKRYIDKNIQNIFLVLDNLSVHQSKKAKEVLAKDCPRIKLVFLPVRSPELNLIEVRWS